MEKEKTVAIPRKVLLEMRLTDWTKLKIGQRSRNTPKGSARNETISISPF